MLQWIRNRYWSDFYLFFSTKVSNFCVCLGHFPSHRLFWLVFIHWIFIFPSYLIMVPVFTIMFKINYKKIIRL